MGARVNDAQPVTQHQPHAKENAEQHVISRRRQRRPLVILQGVPVDALVSQLPLEFAPSLRLAVMPSPLLFVSEQMHTNSSAGDGAQIRQHLRMDEWLFRVEVTDVK